MLFNSPPCPGDPNDYVLVRSREGVFWRRKRKNKATYLNKGFSKSMQLTETLSPIAAGINSSLQPLRGEFYTGRLHNRILTCLRRSIKEIGTMQLAYFKGVAISKRLSIGKDV